MTVIHERPPFRSPRIPPLQNGDRLTRDEFERRYEAMPPGVKAELIEGMVYIVPPPVSEEYHSEPHSDMVGWLAMYRWATPGVIAGDNGTVRLNPDSEAQPDAYLRIASSIGQTKRDADGYVQGAPELVVEVAASSVSYDLGKKLEAYQRNGVREYVVRRTYDKALDWFVLRGDRFEALAPGADGIFRSESFPGLWLDAAALLRGDLAAFLSVAQPGLASTEHAEFVRRLQG